MRGSFIRKGAVKTAGVLLHDAPQLTAIRCVNGMSPPIKPPLFLLYTDPGTRPGLHGQTLISMGLVDLDRLLGGGLPLGTLTLIMEVDWVSRMCLALGTALHS